MAMPTRYREPLVQHCQGRLVVTIDMDERCLLLYPLPEWEVIQGRLERLPNVDPTARRVQRLLIGHATDVDMDGSGRLLLPAMLREFARLDKRLVLLGQGNKLEVWGEELWNERRDQWLEEGGREALDSSEALRSIAL
jgi:MraZ protein